MLRRFACSSRPAFAFAGTMVAVITVAFVASPLFPPAAGRAEEKAAAKPDETTFPVEAVAYFESKVLPLLQARCFECHGPDVKEPKGGLRLDSREAALKGGDTGPSLVPGKPADSALIDAVNYKGFEMPPRSRLPEGEIAILTKWVELGAPWSKGDKPAVVKEEKFPLEERKREHWAWQPIRKVAAPNPGDAHRDWPRNDIDRFLLAKLEEKGLDPAPDADRRTLIRRAHFALIGLPPTPAEIDEFLNDPASTPAAFEKLVDRLLASPHFGERWARHWLDLVRYGETLGHEFDYPLHHAYQYRDYVIRAFNADVPYDQFVREHVAGDLLPNPRKHPTDGYDESLIATGFWFLGEDKHAPVDVRAEEAGKVDNQIDVFSKTFLGLTVGCARCHDHKFDAITMRDYYALFGFLKSSRRQTGLLDPHGMIAAKANELRKLHGEIAASRVKLVPAPSDAQANDFTAMLLATREVLHGEPKPGDDAGQKGNQPDIVFDDFERETWGDNWKAEGPAFAQGPVTGTLPRQQVVSGFAGKRLINSYVGGDGTTGTLTSKPFVIERKSIRFLIGGGAYAGQTCLNLLVDGKVVRTATGKENEKLEPAAWDVSPLLGEQATLQVVDKHTSGWGHVNVDQIVFSDGEGAVATRRPIEVVAKERKLDVGRLRRWTQALTSDEVKSPSHPLSTWTALAATPTTSNSDAFATAKTNWSQRLTSETKAAEESATKTELFEDFNTSDWKGWFVTGEAFAAENGVAHSGLLSNRLCGVLRSKSFILQHPQILYRVAGKNAQIRLICDGYQMDVFNGLLFGGFSFAVNNEQPQWITQAGDIGRYVGHRCHIELIDDGDGWIAVDEIRFAKGERPPVEAPNAIAARLATDGAAKSLETLAAGYGKVWNDALAATRGPSGGNALVSWALDRNLANGGASAAGSATVVELQSRIQKLAGEVPAPMRAVAITDGTPEDERVFIRGSHKHLGPAVSRRMLEAIDGGEPLAVEGSGRLQLAHRLLAPSNPFPARVMANRVWHHLFGRGLVASVDNFGVLGEKPTHPELLDWLAEEFRGPGSDGRGTPWSVKRLVRTIVLSRAWQMASAVNEKAIDVDLQNLLLHRQNLRRLEGEPLRDALLTISGRLDRATYGPSVPVHLTPFMQGRGRPGSGPLDGAGRRSVYTSVNRNFLSPMMLAFDTPIPFTTIGRRNVSNVPAQALILMNDPFVIEQTKLWAKRTLSEPNRTPEQRIDRLYVDAFARPATEDERTEAIAFLKSQSAALGLDEKLWTTDERPWSDLCHVLVNVKEFLFVR